MQASPKLRELKLHLGPRNVFLGVAAIIALSIVMIIWKTLQSTTISEYSVQEYAVIVIGTLVILCFINGVYHIYSRSNIGPPAKPRWKR